MMWSQDKNLTWHVFLSGIIYVHVCMYVCILVLPKW
jgi:hypothetical protein